MSSLKQKILEKAKTRKELCWVDKPKAEVRAWLCKDCEKEKWILVDEVLAVLGVEQE